ncbi:tyrosinase [Burkholderia contaminans FFH2055]|uniref:tyrosinase family protein n=1 Tax=Burkholderia TaxID=32008 RepID=UPI0006268B1F|nr:MULTISPECIES: tyrosinase family protein [Burkholderia]AOL08436.1 tyrosinase [Burkholderia contaminans]KKL35569.1 tyrosinase [Burkholderia contaminans FFH2055]MCA7882296.1 tyrosinase family protein [Burkholderia contaminans]MEB4636936.1 tyrosinase family protein [Burkholderia contaminans]MEB4651521.1 tyrosinase family protein [Burkholderia contaminans]
MNNAPGVRVRPSIESLQAEYLKGNKKPLEDVMRAWKGIKALPPDDPNSFFMIGGFHGEPFRGAGWGSASYWGGYCNHGNVLFPTWHRAYLLRLEQALQSIPGCEQVMLPFWDETSEESLTKGIPWALTAPDFELDGEKIPNPLASFSFNRAITDNINGDNPNYSKPLPYVTVRYPLSGLVGTDKDKAATEKHNAKFQDAKENVVILNRNVVDWLTSYIVVKGDVVPTNVKSKFEQCLDAPNYTVFSNTSSAAQWNENLPDGAIPVVPLESPHNDIHLAVGGFDVPHGPNKGDFAPIPGANGDMGENDTAGLDPIFYFHHCFIDRVFWLWQKRHGYTQHLDVIAEYPGTNSVDAQGPTPGVVPNSWLTLETPLDPFKKSENGKERAYTSLDCINIEEQLGYTYGPGSLENLPKLSLAAPTVPAGNSRKIVRVSGLNRAPIAGSFLVSAYVNVDGERQLLGTEAVLSRWSVQSCANCQTHLEVKAFFPLNHFAESAVQDAQYDVEIHTRDGVRLQTPPASPPDSQAVVGAAPQPVRKLFRLEVR